MLLYPETAVDAKTNVIDRFQTIKEAKEELALITLKAENFGGEYRRKSYVYVLILWLVSIWAMITNLAQALYIKLFKKQGVSNPKKLTFFTSPLKSN